MDLKQPQGVKPAAAFVGISPLAMETAQRYLKKHHAPRPSGWKLMCLFLVFLTAFNTLFATMLLYKNTMIARENMELIQNNRKLTDQLVEIQKAQLDQATLMIAQQLMMRQFSIVDINGRFAAGEDNQPDQALGNDRAQDPLGLDDPLEAFMLEDSVPEMDNTAKELQEGLGKLQPGFVLLKDGSRTKYDENDSELDDWME